MFLAVVFVVSWGVGSSEASEIEIGLSITISAGHRSERKLLCKEEIAVVYSDSLRGLFVSAGLSRLLASEHPKYIEWSLNE